MNMRPDDKRGAEGGARDLRLRPRLARLSVRPPSGFVASAVMEHTRPQFPGAFALGEELGPRYDRASPRFSKRRRRPLARSSPVLDYDLKISASADRFSVRSQIAMAIDAKGDKRAPVRFAPVLARARLDGGGAAAVPGDRTTAERCNRDAFDAARRARQRAQARRGPAHRACRLVGARLHHQARVAFRRGVQRIFGVPPVDLPQWHDRWAKPDPSRRPERRAAEAAAAAMHGGPRYDVEYRVVRPDGAVRVVHSQGDVVTRDESGRPVRQFGVMQDITELRRAEEDLRASEVALSHVRRPCDGRLLPARRSTRSSSTSIVRPAKALGCSREELIGMHPRDFDVGLVEACARAAGAAGRRRRRRSPSRRCTGARTAPSFPVEIRAGMFQQADKRFRLSLARDISDRRLDTGERCEQRKMRCRWCATELARASRVMTLGELTASIAHEVNQPLGAMVANAAACARWLAAEPAEIAEDAQSARQHRRRRQARKRGHRADPGAGEPPGAAQRLC